MASMWFSVIADYPAAEEYGRAGVEAQAAIDGLNNPAIESSVVLQAGFAAFATGDHKTAIREWRRAADLGASSGNRIVEGLGLVTAVTRSVAIDHDDLAELLHEAIDRLDGLRLRSYLYVAMTGLADWWARTGRIELAAQLIGFLDAVDPVGNPTFGDLRTHADNMIAQHPNVEKWKAIGSTRDRDAAVAFCLDQLDADV